MKRQDRWFKSSYTVVVLDPGGGDVEWESCMKFMCIDKKTLSEFTGIKYNRLVYLFGVLKRSYVEEGGNAIIKVENIYRSKRGGIRVNRGISGFNR